MKILMISDGQDLRTPQVDALGIYLSKLTSSPSLKQRAHLATAKISTLDEHRPSSSSIRKSLDASRCRDVRCPPPVLPANGQRVL